MPPQDLKNIKALTFDVFGTVVDWRSTVESALRSAIDAKLSSTSSQLSAGQKEHIRNVLNSKSSKDNDWAAIFAQEWRNAYKHFTRTFVAGKTPWKDIDTHHHDSLVEQLERWDLQTDNHNSGGSSNIFTSEEIKDLSLVWHRLKPWPDSATGLGKLANELDLTTATLSNGNKSLLSDLNDGSPSEGREKLGFVQILSAEDFGAYKPAPKVYLGAAEKLGISPSKGEIAMVAAHLNDLEAAKDCGLRTIYVERKGEEDWAPGEERYQRAREWVDLWIGLDDGKGEERGFVEAARQLGNVFLKKSG